MSLTINNMCPAPDWFARIGNKRRPVACWVVYDEYNPAADGHVCFLRGMISLCGTGLFPAEDHEKFRGYEYAPFDRKERVDAETAVKWMEDNVSGLSRKDIQSHVAAQKARVMMSAIAEQGLEKDWPEEENA